MKKAEIKAGNLYEAKVNNKITVVRVESIETTDKGLTRWRATNLATGRKIVVGSPQRFRREVNRGEQVGGQYRTPPHVTKPQEEAAVAEARAKAESGLAVALREKSVEDTSAPHLVVIARAGTGKTTTLVEGLKIVFGEQSKLTPSPQQAAVWKSLEKSKDAKTVCFVAFNKSIATELQERVPRGCDAMTMHSMGFKAVKRAFKMLPGLKSVNGFRVDNIIEEITGKDMRELRKQNPELIKFTKRLVSLCKQNLVGFEKESLGDELAALAGYYDLDLNGNEAEIFSLVPQILARCLDVEKDGYIDYDDMIWLPVVHNLPVFRYDLLLVDEAQDLNRCQQELAIKAGKRLVFCGDPKQAIYGFAGADSESLNRLEESLPQRTGRDVEVLPLTVTRRCGKSIVAEAKRYVPDFEAFEGNGEGSVVNYAYDDKSAKHYGQYVEDGDMVICRVTAPLVSQCFRFIRAGRKANIQGRDIGQGLISTIRKLKAQDASDLLEKLENWYAVEVKKENSRKNPSDARLIALEDRYECLLCFASEATTIDGIVEKIEAIFTDDNKEGIRLSTGHKAKGLEADNVFILMPKDAPCPHPMARTAWQKDQEFNLLYVMITRAIKRLAYVS